MLTAFSTRRGEHIDSGNIEVGKWLALPQETTYWLETGERVIPFLPVLSCIILIYVKKENSNKTSVRLSIIIIQSRQVGCIQ